MRITRVHATHIEASAWGDFAYREDDLPLVTGMSIYPQYKHPISTWRPEERMCVVEIETGVTGQARRVFRQRKVRANRPCR